VFDLSLTKLAVLAILALVIFGPEQLPKIAAQAGRALRDLRRLADSATRDLKEGLGPEFEDFDITDLHPRNFVRKHLLDDVDLSDLDPRDFVRKHLTDEPSEQDGSAPAGETATGMEAGSVWGGESTVTVLQPGETPPYDAEAT
jgi:sec-independent protein translocase protein TatB